MFAGSTENKVKSLKLCFLNASANMAKTSFSQLSFYTKLLRNKSLCNIFTIEPILNGRISIVILFFLAESNVLLFNTTHAAKFF